MDKWHAQRHDMHVMSTWIVWSVHSVHVNSNAQYVNSNAHQVNSNAQYVNSNAQYVNVTPLCVPLICRWNNLLDTQSVTVTSLCIIAWPSRFPTLLTSDCHISQHYNPCFTTLQSLYYSQIHMHIVCVTVTFPYITIPTLLPNFECTLCAWLSRIPTSNPYITTRQSLYYRQIYKFSRTYVRERDCRVCVCDRWVGA